MDKIKLEIEDYYVLLNLHKALLEAKFHENPDNILVSASPIIADLCNELVDILSKKDELKDVKILVNGIVGENWKQNHFIEKEQSKNALLYHRWLEMKEEDKVKYAKNLLSPFKATDEELKKFIEEVDEKFSLNNIK